MGLGGYLAGKTEADHYKSELKREYDEVERVPEQEKIEVKQVFADFGCLNIYKPKLPMNWLKIKRSGWIL